MKIDDFKSHNYILKDKVPVLEPDLEKWAKWFSNNKRSIAADQIGESLISTVFIGIDHNFFPGGESLLFETMVFDGPLDGEQERYHTWDEAVKGHEEMLKRVKNELNLS